MRRAILVAFILLLIPTASAEDSDGDGYDDPTATYTVWDGADAYPNNPDIHEPVFSSGCDPPVATLDLGEPVTYTCTIANEGPVGLDVLIDVQGDVHLRNLFDGSDHHIGAGDVVTISVTLQGETEGIAMAKVRIFARNGTAPSQTIDLPIQVTGEDWDGMRSHSESNPPDVSFISGILDDFAIYLGENTPYEFDRGRAGVVMLLGIGLMLGAVRTVRARKIWNRNMHSRTASRAEREERFDTLRRGPVPEHHIEPEIPESPIHVITRDEMEYIPRRLRK